MVVLRLTRAGAKKKPFYRIVAVDSRKKRDGKALDILGYYDPRKEADKTHIDMEKFNAWIKKGAQTSDIVKNIVKSAKA